MTQILIVDDDRNYRYALRSILPWEEHGFRIEAEAVHGRQALLVLEDTPIDIIISDISMPQMNGVELIQAVKRKYPLVEIIALSSYDDFEFVKDAMKCGARDYILKHEMRESDILRVVNEARAQIKLSRERPSLDRLSADSRNYLMGSLIRSFLDGAQLDNEQVRQFFHLYHIHGKSPQLGILVADKYASIPPHALERLISAQVCPVFCFESNEHQLALVVNLRDITSTQSVYRFIDTFANSLCSVACESRTSKVTIGIGSIASGYLGIQKSYKQAIEAVRQQTYGGVGRIYRFDEMPREQIDMDCIHTAKQILEDAFSGAKEMDMANAYNTFWSVILKQKPDGNKLNGILQDICINIYNSNAARVGKQPISILQLQEMSASILAAVAATDKRERLLLLLNQWMLDFREASGYGLKVRQAIEYMELHYKENLSVNDIAEQIDLSPNYLSSLFRTETGERITEYLNRIRVERSKKLIMEGRLKNYEIAEIVGFESASYFSAIFKRITGMTIQQFKGQL